MIETIEKAKSITRLPVFCTPEIVLLPFEGLTLKVNMMIHRQLIKDAAHGNRFFGVNFFDKAGCASDKPEIGSIGCIAELKRIRLSSTGGKLADVTGIIRYRIEGYMNSDTIYPAAEITFVEDEPEDETMLGELSAEAGKIIQRTIDKGRRASDKAPDDSPPLNLNPHLASFLLVDLFSLNNADRRFFLESRLTSERLKACCEHLLKIENGADDAISRKQFLKPFYSYKHK